MLTLMLEWSAWTFDNPTSTDYFGVFFSYEWLLLLLLLAVVRVNDAGAAIVIL